MMKRILAPVFVLLVVSLMATVLYARPAKRLDERTGMCRLLSEGRLDWESEPWGQGGRKFQEVCKSCHYRDNDKGAVFLHAQSKMPEGWNRVFAKRRVACATDGSWNGLSEEDIQFVNDYLYRNANWTHNSYSADSCG